MKKNVLITGAARHIGASCAKLLHAQGCNVALHYRSSKQEVEQLCATLNQLRPDSAVILQADLLNVQALTELAQQALSCWEGIDVLINNASSFYPTPLASATEAQWDELMDSNVKAPFFLCQALSESLVSRQGCIVNIADIHAERGGLPGHGVYSITKAGLVAMTKVLAKELAPFVRVNAVAPGSIPSAGSDLSEQKKSGTLQRIALARNGEAEDIAKAVLYLVKDADYVTGQVIAVDGGRTLFY